MLRDDQFRWVHLLHSFDQLLLIRKAMMSLLSPEDLQEVLRWTPRESDDSLAFGSGGRAAFLLESYLQSPKPKTLFFLTEELRKLLRTTDSRAGLFNGLTGSLWVLSRFFQLVPEHAQDWAPSIRNLRERVYLATQRHLERPGRFELMNGAVGIGIVALATGDRGLLHLVNSYLVRHSSRMVRLTDTSQIYGESAELSDKVDLGISHGLPGVILYFSYYLERNANDQELRDALKTLCGSVKAIAFSSPPLLPKFSPGGEPSHHQGWCYGNLSSALSLLRAGTVLNDPELLAFGRKLVEPAIVFFQRSPPQEHHLCHGSSSLLLLFRELKAHAAGEELEALASRIQIESGNADELSGGLLTGAVGVKLARSSFAEPSRSSWESLFLLRAPA